MAKSLFKPIGMTNVGGITSVWQSGFTNPFVNPFVPGMGHSLSGLKHNRGSEESGCAPTMRVKMNGFNIEAPTPDVADALDEALGPVVWMETARTESETEVNGVVIYRIETVTFARPNGEETTLVFNHPPIQQPGPVT